MEREQIINRVVCCLDEAGITQSMDPLLENPIENFLDEAGRELLKVAPAYSFKGKYANFSTQNSGLIDNGDGSGSVLLPAAFVRLVSFCMEGWQRDATHLYTVDDAIARKQSNPYLRGGVANPVVVLSGHRLHYYSLPKGAEHAIKNAELLIHIPVDLLDDVLIDPLAWLTASKVLDVLRENEQAEMARGQYLQCINLLKIY